MHIRPELLLKIGVGSRVRPPRTLVTVPRSWARCAPPWYIGAIVVTLPTGDAKWRRSIQWTLTTTIIVYKATLKMACFRKATLKAARQNLGCLRCTCCTDDVPDTLLRWTHTTTIIIYGRRFLTFPCDVTPKSQTSGLERV